MTTYTNAMLLTALNLVKSRAQQGVYADRMCGLCSAISEVIFDQTGGKFYPTATGILRTYAITWAHFSGALAYPVPHSFTHVGSPISSFGYHSRNRTLWRGENFDLRMSLLDHLIAEIESRQPGEPVAF